MITTSDTPTYSYLRRISGLVIMISSFFVLAFSLQVATAQQAATPKARAEIKEAQTDTIKAAIKATALKLNVTTENGTGDQVSITFDSIAVNKNGNLDLHGKGTIVTANTINGKVNASESNIHGKGTIVTDNTTNGKVNASEFNITLSAQNVQMTDGANPPLYIVDGKEVTAALMRALDPNKIASVDVLKGENAIVTYGKQAKNGVVVIHLKREMAQDSGSKHITPQMQASKIPSTALVLVDGKIITAEEMNKISPDRIESVNVLKGGTAKVKYGEKGKDGVIEIVLKREGEVKNLEK